MFFFNKEEFFSFLSSETILNSIKLGTSKESIINVLGHKFQYTKQKKRNKEILCYHQWINFYFHNNLLVSFSLSFYKLQGDNPLPNISLKDVEDFLNSKNLAYKIKRKRDVEDMDFIIFNKFQLGFESDVLIYTYCG